MRKSYIIGAVVVAAAMIFALLSFKSTLTSYVTIDEAKAGEQYVQVAGLLVQGSDRYDETTNSLYFELEEPDGSRMQIKYDKSKPSNFENADKIVAVGIYNASDDVFHADELLVKCPSKYEGRISE
ncbi:MAG: cytochrome c maturation protein CcmE [candidate division KSB1 bacterium]|jgi:cytochrome c-type biogenesis protein CcmE|nr:cytochrome c maturation protein CcmE [candidate division KSB1 bacterium]